MKLSMYDAAVPVSIRAMNNLAAILEKAAAHAEARRLDPSVLLQGRLFPDMFPLVRQVQIACDTAKHGPARVAGAEAPAHEDNETSFAELIARARKTAAYVETLPKAAFEGAEDRTVTWQARGKSRSMQGLPYLFTHVLPNIYFHVTTAYAILRHNGVELGKADYLGPM
jgi:uncharacterized protein